MNHLAPEPILIVGISSTIRGAFQQLSELGSQAPRILGAVLADAGDTGLEECAGLELLGSIDDLPDLCAHLGPRWVLACLPAALTGARTRTEQHLRRAGVLVRYAPTLGDIVAGRTTGIAAGLDFASLIGRPPRALDTRAAESLLTGKRVLITGAGGSIGSELARRCAQSNPETLILMERSENALFEIDRQLGAMFPGVPRRSVLHDVVDAEGTLRRFVSLRPQIVFHAAAHKHVPMMEDHPAAAVSNNFFGTKSVVDAALAVDVDRFVMISTDKAVNPTSVMGATKRLAETYVRGQNHGCSLDRSHRFRIVRFGNVLGSACSVIPIWSAQIAEGGPITVTHPRMTRYFMTIPEAAVLVLHAGAVETPGTNVFVLDMGEPVNIRELAERFVLAHGLQPIWDDPKGLDSELTSERDAVLGGASIRVVFTGARPGEKLHEELAYTHEELKASPLPGVLCWSGGSPTAGEIAAITTEMSMVRSSDIPQVVLQAIAKCVPGWSKLAPTGMAMTEAA